MLVDPMLFLCPFLCFDYLPLTVFAISLFVACVVPFSFLAILFPWEVVMISETVSNDL